jgi:hypothetical protein
MASKNKKVKARKRKVIQKQTETKGLFEKRWNSLTNLFKPKEEEIIDKCPYCGSKNLQAVAVGKTKGFNTGTGCCGAILLGPFGWLCGMSGMGKGKTEGKRMCIRCGKTF